MRIAVFQFASGADVDENFRKINDAIRLAHESSVRLIVFHECAACGYPPVEAPDINAIDYSALDRHITGVRKLAAECEMYVALGTVWQENGSRFNSTLLIGPGGEILGRYDKRALWGWDLNNFERGNSLGVFDIDGTRVGFRICFEVRFPEYFRELFAAGAELCFVSFSDVSEKDQPKRYDIIKSHLITRAVENIMTVVSVNSISGFQTAPTAVFDINGGTVKEAPKNQDYLLIYDYSRPEIGYGAQGRVEISQEVMRRNLTCSE